MIRPGAAQSFAGRLRKLIARRHRRLGRRVAGNAGSREPRSALAADREPGAAHRAIGKVLVQRLPVYPSLCVEPDRWLAPTLQRACGARSTRTGWAREDDWAPGPDRRAAASAPRCSRRSIPSMADAIERARAGARWPKPDDRAPVRRARRRLRRRSAPPPTSCAADGQRRDRRATWSTATSTTPTSVTTAAGSAPSPKARRTRRCAARHTTCDWTKSSVARGRPGTAAPPKCACKAASIPDYTGETYLGICRAIKAAVPEMHIHAFSPLEVTQGAATLGLSLHEFLARLKDGGPRHAARHRGGNSR